MSEWHERVTRCSCCPFSQERGDDEMFCEAYGGRFDPARLITDAERATDAPPEWCPLRSGPRTVALAGSKDGTR